MDPRTTDTSAPALRHKFAAPGVPRGSIERPRLDHLLDTLFDSYAIVEIVAAPGAGKTVEAQLFARRTGRRLAWLTMDRSDRSASGLVFDLATALGPVAGDAVDAMRGTLQSNGTAEEAAAILASASGGEDVLVVIDECQQISASPDAASALDTFLEYLPDRMRMLLLSREELPWPLQRRYVHGQIAQLGDATLNLTLEETAEYVRRADAGPDAGLETGMDTGPGPDTCERIFSATGGWAAGVAFASRFGLGEQPNLRDLSAYFGRQVLGPLPEDERRFLLDTSVTGTVTPEVAAALCGPDGQRLWLAVSARHLPATSATSSAIVVHSLFRSFLRQRLIETEPERHVRLRAAYAGHLAAVRQFEDATEVWLSLGDLDQAVETAVQAFPALFGRADWPVVKRWLEAFGETRVHADPRLIGACVRAAHGMREFDRARALIRGLDRKGRLRAAIELDPSLLAIAAWVLQAHPQEALGLLDKYEGDSGADVVRYMIEVAVATRYVPPPDARDLPDVDRQMSWGLFLQGRLGELARMGNLDDESVVLNPNLVLAAAFREETDVAGDLWRRVPQEIRERAHSRFIEAILNLANGDHESAREHLRLAMADSQRSGFSLLPVYEIFMGYLQFTDVGAEAGIAQLEPVLDEMSRTGQTAYVEIAQCFLGLAYLRAGRTEEARLILRETVTSMTRCQRRLMLAMAAAGLSEAEARLGNAEAATGAAEQAYHVSMLTGSFSLLIQSIKLFPDILRRELERAPDDSRWRRLVVAPSARPGPSGAARQGVAEVTMVLQPFGRYRDLLIDGRPAGIGRTKILELVACLALHPRGIDRFELQRRLLPDADQRSGGNHFRQIVHKLRRSSGVNLERRGNLVMLPETTAFVANDIESERMLATAGASSGPERRARLEAGLELAPGRYLDGSSLPWAEERRNYLDLVHEEARLELATIYLELGRAEAARGACEAVLETNRYSDPAYRVLVAIERKVGSESSVLAVYRRATEALAELGLRPGDARRLLNRDPVEAGPARTGRAGQGQPRRGARTAMRPTAGSAAAIG
ncbi:BTAD domain-containing putative transcriptional regulator [Actinomadura rugatobispora]|uniref:BTAD domain-containing putative transcriptional regulator n=1 Tax=Actinomadura rugatobispora TaxID=1994 RepID=A0ABW1AG19_9ACTN